MSEGGSSESDSITVRELISDFFCWLVLPIVGFLMFVISGFIIQFQVIERALYFGFLILFSMPTILAITMWLFAIMKERGGRYHLLLILLGQVLMIFGALIPLNGFNVSMWVGEFPLFASYIMLWSVIPNFLGFLAWLNMAYMRSRQ